MTVIDRFATLTADAQAQAQAQMAEQARQRQAEQQRVFMSHCAQLADYFPPAIMDLGWRFEAGTRVLNATCAFTLVATFLPEDVRPLRLRADYPHYRGQSAPSLHLQCGSHMATFDVGVSVEQIEAFLAPLVTEYVAHEREAREVRHRYDADRADEDARRERLNTQITAIRRLAEAKIKVELGSISAHYGWPEGRSIDAYEMTWTEGVDGEGRVQKSDPYYLLDPNPDQDGFYTVLRSRDTTRIRVVGTTVVTQAVTWRQASELPYGLKEHVYRIRRVEIWDAAGERRLYVGDNVSGQSVALPSPSIRRLLGVAGDEIPQRGETELIAVRQTEDGFDPFTPPAAPVTVEDDDFPY